MPWMRATSSRRPCTTWMECAAAESSGARLLEAHERSWRCGPTTEQGMEVVEDSWPGSRGGDRSTRAARCCTGEQGSHAKEKGGEGRRGTGSAPYS